VRRPGAAVWPERAGGIARLPTCGRDRALYKLGAVAFEMTGCWRPLEAHSHASRPCGGRRCGAVVPSGSAMSGAGLRAVPRPFLLSEHPGIARGEARPATRARGDGTPSSPGGGPACWCRRPIREASDPGGSLWRPLPWRRSHRAIWGLAQRAGDGNNPGRRERLVIVVVLGAGLAG